MKIRSIRSYDFREIFDLSTYLAKDYIQLNLHKMLIARSEHKMARAQDEADIIKSEINLERMKRTKLKRELVVIQISIKRTLKSMSDARCK